MSPAPEIPTSLQPPESRFEDQPAPGVTSSHGAGPYACNQVGWNQMSAQGGASASFGPRHQSSHSRLRKACQPPQDSLSRQWSLAQKNNAPWGTRESGFLGAVTCNMDKSRVRGDSLDSVVGLTGTPVNLFTTSVMLQGEISRPKLPIQF